MVKRTLREHADAQEAQEAQTTQTAAEEVRAAITVTQTTQPAADDSPKPLARRKGRVGQMAQPVEQLIASRPREHQFGNTVRILTESIEMPLPGEISREDWDDDDITDMAKSIWQFGLMQPIVVRDDPAGNGKYRVVIGSLRLMGYREAARRALDEATKAGTEPDPRWDTIEAVIQPAVNAEDALKRSFASNVHVRRLNPIELALAITGLIEHAERRGERSIVANLAREIGWHESHIYHLLRTLTKAPSIQRMIRLGEITEKDSRVLDMLEDKDDQQLLAEALAAKRKHGRAFSDGEATAIARGMQRGLPLRVAIAEIEGARTPSLPGYTPAPGSSSSPTDAEFRPAGVTPDGTRLNVVAQAIDAARAQEAMLDSQADAPAGQAGILARARYEPGHLPVVDATHDIDATTDPAGRELVRRLVWVQDQLDEIVSRAMTGEPSDRTLRQEMATAAERIEASMKRLRTTLTSGMPQPVGV